MSDQASSKKFDTPDEVRDFADHGRLEIVTLDNEISVGRGVFEPGWRWSNDVKPIAETESCEAEHSGYCTSGSMVVRMNDGQEIRVSAGETFHIPPGHDAWVEGGEACELIDFQGFKDYAIVQAGIKKSA